jgi:NADP-dependent 3-hydroxy acid dehydrogenase YdfG
MPTNSQFRHKVVWITGASMESEALAHRFAHAGSADSLFAKKDELERVARTVRELDLSRFSRSI